MQRLPSILSLALVSSTAFAGSKDIVYQQTRHGNATSGVNRSTAAPVGHCLHCHQREVQPSTNAPMLFQANTNALCFTCHQSAGAAVYLGQTSYLGTAHWTSNKMLWPGPTPAARPAGDTGECLNCHTPHGALDATGLVPNLEYVREEALCLACHDATGPASTNVQADIIKVSNHPVTDGGVAGRHAAREAQVGATFAGTNRHVECVDCHNPHAATDAAKLAGVARVAVTNGGAGTTPTYTVKPASDSSAVKEYEVCFKCHSAFTTLPTGRRDTSVEFNPANQSFHPVEGAGKNTTTAMTNSLAGGTGLPHLTTSSVITCSDCHGSDALPVTVSTAAAYTGTVPTGPHGSTQAGVLRARYDRNDPLTATPTPATNFALCIICHAAAPFATTSKNARTDTNFPLHGFHVVGERTSCTVCHSNSHSTKLGGTGNTNYARGVSFGPTVTGSRTWSQTNRTCSLTCHGFTHNAENY